MEPETVFSPIPDEIPRAVHDCRYMWTALVGIETRCDFRDRYTVERFGKSNNLEYFFNRTDLGPRRKFSII